jgi:uncharacterized protein (TIGR03435 family)
MKKVSLDQRLERFGRPPLKEIEAATERVWRNVSSQAGARPLPGPTPLPVIPMKGVPSRNTARFSRQLTPARIAACFAALLLASSVFYIAVIRPNDLYAIVETTGGSVVQISQGRELPAKVGDKIGMDTPVRTGSGAQAKLRLPDGSRIELQPESQLSWQRAQDGLHIQLTEGSINVTPAEEAIGKLYVQNREQTVPVFSTIFQTTASPIQSAATPTQPVKPPVWDVVSIRPCENTGGEGRGGGGGGAGGGPPQFDAERMIMKCMSVVNFIQSAYLGYAPDVLAGNRGMAGYAVHTVNIEGGPGIGNPYGGWTASERYTIEAKADKPADRDTMRGAMLQTILEDRFKLKIRRETREVPVLALIVAKGGPKMPSHQEGSCVHRVPGEGFGATPPPGGRFCERVGGATPTSTENTITAEGLTVEEFMKAFLYPIGYQEGKPLIDKTGLTSKYDFRVHFAFPAQQIKDFAARTGRPESDFPTGPTFVEALEDQLGLKLESTKGPWERLVIDHVERPSPN